MGLADAERLATVQTSIKDAHCKAILHEMKALDLTYAIDSDTWCAKVTERDDDGVVRTRATPLNPNQIRCLIRKRCLDCDLVPQRGKALVRLVDTVIARVKEASIAASQRGLHNSVVRPTPDGRYEYVTPS